MRLSSVFLQVATFLIYPAVIFTAFLYLYPLFLSCDFPAPTIPKTTCFLEHTSQDAPRIAQVAPFRLLALGDPQLEGDSSLPGPEHLNFPSIQALRHRIPSTDFRGNLELIAVAIRDLFTKDFPLLLWSYRKRLDLLGNDYYLAHIYRTLHWWLQPTHVTVLGDLIGSQWVNDEEFDWRGWRFWNRVFNGGRRVRDDIKESGISEILGDDPEWSTRIINVAGNHDIGYAGDIDRARVDRFEQIFGKANWNIKFQLLPNRTESSSNKPDFGGPPELRIIVLNSMNLDGPVLDTQLQQETYDFINQDIIGTSRAVEDRKTGTIVLTHIPLHKKEGICVDAPFFDYGENGLTEQNHLSVNAAKGILEGILGMSGDSKAAAGGIGRNGIILTGHDHEGCDVYHYIPVDAERDGSEWSATPWRAARHLVQADIPGVREITVRSMMGSFGGNAGLLSAWFDYEAGEWRFEYATCALGVQHFWWGVHVLDLVTLLLFAASLVSWVTEKGKTATTLTKFPLKSKSSQPYTNGHVISTAKSMDADLLTTRQRSTDRVRDS